MIWAMQRITSDYKEVIMTPKQESRSLPNTGRSRGGRSRWAMLRWRGRCRIRRLGALVECHLHTVAVLRPRRSPQSKMEMPPDEPTSICSFKQIAYNPRIWRLTTMPLFICRWQNGDFSAVHARSREDAIILLDEVGNAEQCELFAVRDFMVHFHLHDEVTDLEEMIPVELEGFGEDTFDMLCDRLYPVYQQAIIKAEEGWPEDKEVPQEKEDAALKDVNEALTTERWRQWGAKEPEISDDPEAAWLQAFVHDFPRAAAERVVKTNRRQIIEMPPSTDEVQ